MNLKIKDILKIFEFLENSKAREKKKAENNIGKEPGE